MRRIPGATYRLQFRKDFPFSAGREIVPYLHALGITDVYSSPVFQASPGSSHGYNVTDPTHLNPELGEAADFRALSQELRSRGMGLLLDIVPNHMSASLDNPWWASVLEHGRASHYAHHFDIRWQDDEDEKIVLPVLGKDLSEVLQDGELSLGIDEHGLELFYYDNPFPVDPRTYAGFFAYCLSRRSDEIPSRGFRSRLEALRELAESIPPRSSGNVNQRADRLQKAARLKRRLLRIYTASPAGAAFIDGALRSFSAPGGADNPLAGFVTQQAYRLVFWREGAKTINYRRFFDIDQLASQFVQDPRVFRDSHRLALRLVREGSVTGLRIDHIDGLYDPLGYLRRLQRSAGRQPRASGRSGKCYVVVEKILMGDEDLPAGWPVDGTTGYDFVDLVNRVFVHRQGLQTLSRAYADFCDKEEDFETLVHHTKLEALRALFVPEFTSLRDSLFDLLAQHAQISEETRQEVSDALEAATVSLPVYRTYTREEAASAADKALLRKTAEEVVRHHPQISEVALGLLFQVLTLDYPSDLPPRERRTWVQWIMRWQQLTGPVMAKGLEDTAFYRHHRLIALNEVGASPATIHRPLSLEDFHARVKQRGEQWPHTMNASSTHDTKRSEDVRMRLHSLSELTAEWSERVARWEAWNKGKKRRVQGQAVPFPQEEVLVYQTLIGVWPLDDSNTETFRERVKTYLIKAARESGEHTSWVDIKQKHEDALTGFVDRILGEDKDNRFLADLLDFKETISFYGALNSLGMVLLKATAPGTPDFYQGNELWDFSLTDPDNRRPVDYGLRMKMLEKVQPAAGGRDGGKDRRAKVLLGRWKDGAVKLYVTAEALRFRNERGKLFEAGEYLPLYAPGDRQEHVLAFARRRQDAWSITAVPRFAASLCAPGAFPLGDKVWTDGRLQLPDGAPVRWRNALTDEVIEGDAGGLSLARVFGAFPVALLEGLP